MNENKINSHIVGMGYYAPENIIDNESANDHIDFLSNRYTGKPYRRNPGVSWNEANIKSREIWEVNPGKVISMVRPQAKSDPE